MNLFKSTTLAAATLVVALGASFSAQAATNGAPTAATLAPIAQEAPRLASIAPVEPIQPTSLEGRPIVAMPGDYAAGTIVVRNSERKLYLSLGDGKAIVYPVAIGKPGRAFTGTVTIVRKAKNPGWTPTPNIRAENPGLPAFVPPGPNNPLGPRALYLSKGFYRIHGTNKPSSIGHAASSGCIRMFNKDVIDLFARVEAGATVHVIQ